MQIKFFYIISIVILAGDLISKHFLDGVTAEFIPNVISISSTHNYGASWSILSGATVLFIVLAGVFLAGMLAFDIFYKRDFGVNCWYKVGFALIFGGILGNLVDRIALGYVRDFIKLEFMDFPIFNIADISLTVGCICLVIWLLFFGMRDRSKKEMIRVEE